MATKNRTIGALLTTSNADIYTVPTRYIAEVSSIIVSNASSAAKTFSLDWYDTVTSTWYTIAELVTLQPNSLLQITHSFMLQAGDKFRGLASAADSITVSIRVEESYSVVTQENNMFIIEFMICLSVQDCTILVDVPRSMHRTQEDCLKVAYIKSLELAALNRQFNPEVTFRCVETSSKDKEI